MSNTKRIYERNMKKQKLISWDTPFKKCKDPSVLLIVSWDNERADVVKAIVAPNGIDEYPKYIVDFGMVVAYLSMEEGYSPKRDFEKVECVIKDLCSYQWLNSPWLQSYEKGKPFIPDTDKGPLCHYMIFGGDNNVEVITCNEPKIEKVFKEKVLSYSFKI